MRVTVEVKNLGDLRDVVGTTHKAIAKVMDMTDGSANMKILGHRPFYTDELPRLARAILKAPRGIKVTIKQLLQLISGGGGSVRRKRFLRGVGGCGDGVNKGKGKVKK